MVADLVVDLVAVYNLHDNADLLCWALWHWLSHLPYIII